MKEIKRPQKSPKLAQLAAMLLRLPQEILEMEDTFANFADESSKSEEVVAQIRRMAQDDLDAYLLSHPDLTKKGAEFSTDAKRNAHIQQKILTHPEYEELAEAQRSRIQYSRNYTQLLECKKRQFRALHVLFGALSCGGERMDDVLVSIEFNDAVEGFLSIK